MSVINLVFILFDFFFVEINPFPASEQFYHLFTKISSKCLRFLHLITDYPGI